MRNIPKKVTIFLHISFQLSYNKADKDPYNPIHLTAHAEHPAGMNKSTEFYQKTCGTV